MGEQVSRVVVGMDPHKRRATIEVMAADVLAKLSARARVFATGQGRKNRQINRVLHIMATPAAVDEVRCGAGCRTPRLTCRVMADNVLDYSQPGMFTRLDVPQLRLIEGLPDDPVGICAAAQALVIQPADAAALGIGGDRLAEKNIRPVNELIAALTALDPSRLHLPRTPETRVIGTCRHFASVACAFLRARGIASRARCGFGTYFLEGRGVDHWITEYWDSGARRWVRIDTEHLGKHYVERPEDLAPGEFLTGGEAWARYRAGLVEGQMFGVAGVEHAWGSAEISGNAVRDLAALCGWEMLNWDEWGRMTEAYEGRTGPDYDHLIDQVADVCSTGDSMALAHLFAMEDLAVPSDMLK